MGRFDRGFKRGYGYADHGKNRIKTVMKLLMIFTTATFLSVAVLAVSEIFRVKSVVVVGNKVYSESIIAAASSIREGDSYGGALLTHAEENIKRELPYIKDVKVEKAFPADVKITVCEYPQVYYTVKEGMAYALSDKLVVLARSTDAEDYSRLNGAELRLPYYVTPKVGESIEMPIESSDESTGAEEETTDAVRYEQDRNKKYAYIFECIDAFDSSDFAGRMSCVDVCDKYNVSFVFENRIKVKIGTLADVEEKLTKAMYIIEKRDNENVVAAVIDVSVPSTATWRELLSLDEENRELPKVESETEEITVIPEG